MTPEEQVEALKKQNQELLDELKPIKSLKKTLDELGGLDSIKSLIEESSELKSKLTEKSTDVETVRNQLNKKLEDSNKKLETFKNRIANTKTETKLKEVAKEYGATWEFLEGRIKSRVKSTYNDDTDELAIQVLDSTGKPLIKDGKEADLGMLFDELKADDVFKKAFEINTARSGTGAPPPAITAKGATSKNPFISGNLDEQTKLWQQNTPLARRLQAEAKGVTA